jgi:uncharacterized spore protein YtfJ
MTVGQGSRMTARQILEQARDTLTVKRVFGEPVAGDGCLMVPVAALWGGGGGGEGRDGEGSDGSGGGFGVMARPVGVYRLRGDEVTWVPAFDLTRVALLGELVGLVALLVLRSIGRNRARR